MSRAVVLAGGRGTRLAPYTTVLPKPLLPIGDRSILESLLLSLRKHGFTDIIISLGHLGHLVRAVIGDGSNLGINVNYVFEDEPRGTAGCLSLIPNLNRGEEILVVNGDTFTNFNFQLAVEALRANSTNAVLVCTRREEISEFGLVQSDAQGFLIGIEEKPKKTYFVSTGINVFKGDMIKKYLPEGYFDMPDFFNLLSASGESVYCLETDSVWLDLGRESDLVKANEMIKDFRE